MGKRTDTERLDWLAKQGGAALVNDDFGHWAVSFDGMQNVPRKTPADIQTMFVIEKKQWKKTIRQAIDAAMNADGD